MALTTESLMSVSYTHLAGHDGASDYAIEGIHAMQAAGLHFGPVSGRQPSAMGWMFKNRSGCYSTGAFCNGQVMLVDGEVVASRAIDNDALMRLADYLEQETDDTYLKVYSLGDDFWNNDAHCVTSDPERVRRAMESGGNAWLKGEEAPDVYKRQEDRPWRPNRPRRAARWRQSRSSPCW